MPDLKLALAADLSSVDLQWSENGDDLLTGDDLITSVETSMFSDRTDPLTLVGDRRGWWADEYRGDLLGSRIWTLARAKRTTQTLRRAEDYAREALAWLIRDGVADTVIAKASWLNGSMLWLDVEIVQAGRATRNISYQWVWN
jgi:phage gp46-like protein